MVKGWSENAALRQNYNSNINSLLLNQCTIEGTKQKACKAVIYTISADLSKSEYKKQ